MGLPRLRSILSRRRKQREADGILRVGAVFQLPHFSYTVYQEAVELLEVEVPDQVAANLKKLDRTPWDQMTQDAKLFVYQSCMALLPTLV